MCFTTFLLFISFSPLFLSFFQVLQILPGFSIWTKYSPPGGGEEWPEYISLFVYLLNCFLKGFETVQHCCKWRLRAQDSWLWAGQAYRNRNDRVRSMFVRLWKKSPWEIVRLPSLCNPPFIFYWSQLPKYSCKVRVRNWPNSCCRYVATRWYRAPEIMLNWMHYNQTGGLHRDNEILCLS